MTTSKQALAGKIQAYRSILTAMDEEDCNKYIIRPDCQIEGLAEIYQAYLGYVTDGTFVEIGAYDGVSWSNTYGLVQMGWDGVYVEPTPKYYQKCLMNHASHSKVKILNALVSSARRTLTMYMRDGDIATVDERFIEEMHLQNCPTHTMESMTLDDVLHQMEISARFELLVIDVEGHEPDVLKGFDIDLYEPKMIIIEAHEKSTYSLLNYNVQFINDYMRTHNYVKVHADTINSIFVKLDKFSDVGEEVL